MQQSSVRSTPLYKPVAIRHITVASTGANDCKHTPAGVLLRVTSKDRRDHWQCQIKKTDETRLLNLNSNLVTLRAAAAAIQCLANTDRAGDPDEIMTFEHVQDNFGKT
jgi:hypothetical protein